MQKENKNAIFNRRFGLRLQKGAFDGCSPVKRAFFLYRYARGSI
jgi:hypothetical protein